MENIDSSVVANNMDLILRQKIDAIDTALAILMSEQDVIEKNLQEQLEKHPFLTSPKKQHHPSPPTIFTGSYQGMQAILDSDDSSSRSRNSSGDSDSVDAEDEERNNEKTAQTNNTLLAPLVTAPTIAPSDSESDDIGGGGSYYDNDDDSNEGPGYAFHVSSETISDVERILNEVHNDADVEITCLSTSGNATLFLFDDNDWAYTGKMPLLLLYELSRQFQEQHQNTESSSSGNRGRESVPAARRPAPVYISMAHDDRFLIKLDNDMSLLDGPKALKECLRSKKARMAASSLPYSNQLSSPSHQQQHYQEFIGAVQTVAFGVKYDAFFIVYDDGTYEYHGSSIPKTLVDTLQREEASCQITNVFATESNAMTQNIQQKKDMKQQKLLHLMCVTLGPKGEWFLKDRDGRSWWGGNLTKELKGVIQDIEDTGDCITFMDFGVNGTYFIRYE